MKTRPFSLQAYLALARGRPRGAAPERAPRPDGPLIWLHADTTAAAKLLLQLASRIYALRGPGACLVTCEDENGAGITTDSSVFHDVLPDETLTATRAFLDHWKPDLCLWTSHMLRPALLHRAAETGFQRIFVNAKDVAYATPILRWMPDVVPSALQDFTVLLAQSRAAARRLRRMDLGTVDIRTTTGLMSASLPLPCIDSDHQMMAEQLAGRPVWLAARLRRDEIETVLIAHRRASRMAHRTLLIINPDPTVPIDALKDQLKTVNLRYCSWDDGHLPDDSTQVLISEDPADLGLWYRLSPISFLGGSIATGHGGTNPFEAAQLGSAILYGPNVRKHLSTYSRLAEAGAARIVRDTDTLSAAVSRLLAPDQAAAMAHAAWDIASSGAETADLIVDLANDALDTWEATDAPA